ncbi:MAG TPA: hypothetical protein PKZ76_10235, partial [Xanthomonadaceae bacterium]|nr:hypothetical protein [Xanthomonadaceae bacterium]
GLTQNRGERVQGNWEARQQGQMVAPLAHGAKVGELVVSLDGETLIQQPLFVLEARPEGGFFRRMSDGMRLWWAGD